MKKIQNIAILAHVDAGKTSISEHFLFLSGKTRSMGSVDKGTSHTDFLEIEKERGISVRAAGISFEYNDTQINLIDTPGHADFSAEIERSLLAVDAAILVVSSMEAVQSHTETIWEKLSDLKIPTLIFVNKIDRAGVDLDFVIHEIKKNLSTNIISLQEVENEGTKEASIKNSWNENLSSDKEIYNTILEAVAEKDDELLEKYFDGTKISFQEIEKKIIFLCQKGELFPIFYGSAKHNVGLEDLLKAAIHYLPKAEIDDEAEFSAVIYKVEHDKSLGKLSHIRLFSGKLESRQAVFNLNRDLTEKVSQLKKIYTRRYEDIKEVRSGDVTVVSGFSEAKAGDILGSESAKIKLTKADLPLLKVKVLPENESQFSELLAAFLQLADEDPKLNLQWITEQRELHVSIQGKIQIEILSSILQERFGIKAKFEKPSIIYKETPARVGEGLVRYTMPKPCWAVMRFKIEPLAQASGVEYSSLVGVNDIKQRYQNQAERAIPKSLQQGIKGWEVTDLRITLIEGEDHEMHTHPLDFTVATPMGIMNALSNTDTELLEPILTFKLTAPEENLGTIAGDLTRMRAVFGNPEFENQRFTMIGTVPLATSLDYASQLASKTSGKGKLNLKFHSYQKCPEGEGETTEYRGISPLDTAKYILHIRNAL